MKRYAPHREGETERPFARYTTNALQALRISGVVTQTIHGRTPKLMALQTRIEKELGIRERAGDADAAIDRNKPNRGEEVDD